MSKQQLLFAGILTIASIIPIFIAGYLGKMVLGAIVSLAMILNFLVCVSHGLKIGNLSLVLFPIVGVAAVAVHSTGSVGVVLLFLAVLCGMTIFFASKGYINAGRQPLLLAILLLLGPEMPMKAWLPLGVLLAIGAASALGVSTLLLKGRVPSLQIPTPRGLRIFSFWLLIFCLGGAAFVHLEHLEYGQWFLLPLVMDANPFPGVSRMRFRERLLGTIAGALLAMVLIAILPEGGLMEVALVVLLFFLFYVSNQGFSEIIFFLTPLAILIAHFNAPYDSPTLAWMRLLYVVGAFIIGFLVSLLYQKPPKELRIQQ